LTGVAFQVKKFALLSADYEFVDYSIARFSETGDNFDYSEKNLNIKNSLKSASNIRLGGEFRIDKLYLRTGYGYYGKAFKPGEDNENLDFSSFSLGAGYREQNVSIDFAFTSYRSTQKYVLYALDTSFDPAIASLNTVRNMFTITVGYKF
jgi:predicted porin